MILYKVIQRRLDDIDVPIEVGALPEMLVNGVVEVARVSRLQNLQPPVFEFKIPGEVKSQSFLSSGEHHLYVTGHFISLFE